MSHEHVRLCRQKIPILPNLLKCITLAHTQAYQMALDWTVNIQNMPKFDLNIEKRSSPQSISLYNYFTQDVSRSGFARLMSQKLTVLDFKSTVKLPVMMDGIEHNWSFGSC